MSQTLADSRELLIKEVRYRASYRGTLELDLVCRPLVEHLDELDDAELAGVRDLLLNKEGDLVGWLVEGKAVPDQWQLAVALVRHLFKQAKAA